MLPAACTSFDGMMHTLGSYWRRIHLLNIPVLLFAVIHSIGLGSHYLGAWEHSWLHWLAVLGLSVMTLGVLLLRWRWVWSLFSLERFYAPIYPSK
ncbi:hypothetical protein [Neosynechococcus sphagnicola]|uniref:hypothetical protein n=1 Tax=Neosynechococcus sphagnicola TaxID=1501145 RepID=UPI001EF9D37F|nr:hypothetical protein [Neosynechococcus sphagnicola]